MDFNIALEVVSDDVELLEHIVVDDESDRPLPKKVF